MNEQKAIAICGVKNAGANRVIESVIPELIKRKHKVAVIKHDAHDFEADVPGTDTYRYKEAGAYATAIYSKNKYMVVKEEPKMTAERLMELFPEADLIIIEGLKFSHFPKIELVKGIASETGICDPKTVIAYASDMEQEGDIPVYTYDQTEKLADAIEDFMKKTDERSDI